MFIEHDSIADTLEPEAPDDHRQPVGDRGIIPVQDQIAIGPGNPAPRECGIMVLQVTPQSGGVLAPGDGESVDHRGPKVWVALIGREAEIFAGQQTPPDCVWSGDWEPGIAAVHWRDGAVYFGDRSVLMA
jgi:hypothetical protein